MAVSKTLVGGAKIISSPHFEDDRGWFSVPYERSSLAQDGITETFVQDNHSYSKDRGTLRGIHLQMPPHEQGKLVRVLKGCIVDVVIDLRPDSPTFGQHESVILKALGDQIWVPRGFGHAFCTLEDHTEVLYKVDSPYMPEHERSIRWDDSELGIDWPTWLTKPIMSDKDKNAATLTEIIASIKDACS